MTIIEAAILYNELGLNVIPVSKEWVPLVRWELWQDKKQTLSDINSMFKEDTFGIAVITGGEGGIEVIDIDTKNDPTSTIAGKYGKAIVDAEIPTDFLTVKTRSGGYHFIYRTNEPGRNQPLARIEVDGKPKVIIETRSGGGIVFAYPTPGYSLKKGSLDNIPLLSEETRDSLFVLARFFDEVGVSKPKTYGDPVEGRKSTWEDFNDKNDYTYIVESIEELGWTECGSSGDRLFYTRPGKNKGVSADVNMKLNLFKSFSTNGYPFEPEQAYTPFDIYALIHHNGDGKEAGRDLYNQGYGDRFEPEVVKDDIYAGVYVFDPSNPPPHVEPCVWVETAYKSYPVVAMSRIMAIGGLSGSGKTTFLQSLYTSTLKGSPFLGVRVDLNNRDLVVVDTEQDDAEIYEQNMKMLKVINASSSPTRFHSVGIADLDRTKGDKRRMAEIRREKVEEILKNYGRKIGFLVLDNARDLVINYNDVDASLEFADWLKKIKRMTGALVCVILHTAKTSGGLKGNTGTILYEIASAYLLIEKALDDSHSIVKAVKTRGYAPFPEIRFTWNDIGMATLYSPVASWGKRD